MTRYANKCRKWAALVLVAVLLCSLWGPVSVQAEDMGEDVALSHAEESESVSGTIDDEGGSAALEPAVPEDRSEKETEKEAVPEAAAETNAEAAPEATAEPLPTAAPTARELSADEASGTHELEFRNIYSEQMNGEIKITGNTLLMPDTRYYQAKMIDAYGKAGLPFRGTSQNNNLYMGAVDRDDDPQTRNSSSAEISIAKGASVEKAFLIWGGTSAPGNATNDKGGTSGTMPQVPPEAAPEDEVVNGPVIKFKTPQMDSYTVIALDFSNRLTVYRKDYTACADVTQLVQAGGSGRYWAGDLPLSTGYDVYGGWALVIVYRDDTRPLNDLNVFFGHRIIDRSTVAEIQIGNLVTPPSGPVRSSIGMVMWEGDYGGTGDYIEIAKDASAAHRKISDPLNPENNMAGASMTYKGTLVSERIPDYVNTHGMDAKVIELTDYMENNQSALHLRAGSSGDIYYPTIFTTEIELYKPRVNVTKTAKNLSRPDDETAVEGDVIEYTVNMKNIGYDTATFITAVDVLPDGVDFVPGSVEHYENDSWLAKTDASGDDEVMYSGADRTLTFHVGVGGTASVGGALAYEAGSSYRYRVIVNGTNTGPISNTVQLEYSGSDGERSKGGSSGATSVIEAEPQKISFTFTKEADKSQLSVGDVIVYTFTIKNTGNVTLSNLTLNDPVEGLSMPVLNKTSLKPGETATAVATYTVTQADMRKVQLENTATVMAVPVQRGNVPTSPITETSTVIIPNPQRREPIPSGPGVPPSPSEPSNPIVPPGPDGSTNPSVPPSPDGPTNPSVPPSPDDPINPSVPPSPGEPISPSEPSGTGEPHGARKGSGSSAVPAPKTANELNEASHTPQTGDHVPVVFWMTILLSSLAVFGLLCGLEIRRRKKGSARKRGKFE